MYTLATTHATVSTWCLARGLRNDRYSSLWWCCYSVVATSFLYTHNYALFTVFGQACFVFAYFFLMHLKNPMGLFWSREWWRSVTALASVVWLYLPWFGILLQQKRRVQSEYWIGDIGWWSIPDALCLLFMPRNDYLVRSRWESAAVVAAIAAVLLAQLWKAKWTNWLALFMVLVPIVCATAVSIVSVSIIVPRHFIFSQVFVFCVVAYVVWYSTSTSVRVAVVSLLLFNSLYVHTAYCNDLRVWEKPGVRGAVEYVKKHAAPDDPIVVLHPCIYHVVKYYTRETKEPLLYLPRGMPNHFQGGPLLEQKDLIRTEQFERFGDSRIWVLDTTGFPLKQGRSFVPSPWIADGDTQSFPDVYFFQGEVTVSEFKRRARPDVGSPTTVLP